MRFPDLDVAAAHAELLDARAALHHLGDWWSEAMADVGLGLLSLVRGEAAEGFGFFQDAAGIGADRQDLFTTVVAGNNLARMHFFMGDVDTAESEYRESLARSARLGFDEGTQYALEGMSAVAAARGDAWRAGALAAAANAVRQRVGLFDVEGYAVQAQPLEALREADPEGVAAGERDGADMTLAEALAVALPDRGSVSA